MVNSYQHPSKKVENFSTFETMNWKQIIGQGKIIETLQDSINNGRVSHAQLFVGEEGFGGLPLALAYAQEILSQENPHASQKVERLNHLDLHFSFPIFSEKNESLSKRCFDDWRNMILENPYASFDDWTEILDAENKQFQISVAEVEDFTKNFTLKSYEGGTKILIVWRADKMRTESSNKLLKFLEEPPEKTIIILLAENQDFILPTILSRCQITEIPRIEENIIQQKLVELYSVSEENAQAIAHQSQGNWNTALKILNSENSTDEFETLFIEWVRNAFQAKKKPQVLKEIVQWARNISAWNREKQKNFLDYCIEIFRLALLKNYNNPSLVYLSLQKDNFQWGKFASYIHGANIEAILDEISTTDLHLKRNGNAKLVWTDMGIKLTRYLHRPAS